MFEFLKNRRDELSNQTFPIILATAASRMFHGARLCLQLLSAARPSGNFTKVMVKGYGNAGVIIRAHLLGVCINGSHGRPNRHEHGRDSCRRTEIV